MHFIESKVMTMTMQTDNTDVKINFDHLLWRSRSKGQDYQFINSPKSPSIDGWFSVFNKVFSGHEPGREPKNIIGKLVVPGNNHKSESFAFIAIHLIDDKYLDSSGRPIKQYLIWFQQNYDISEINKLANDWGRDLMASSREAYSSFYESSDISKLAEQECVVIKRANVDLQKLDFKDIGEIKYGFHAIELSSTQPLYDQIIMIFKKLLKKIIRS